MTADELLITAIIKQAAKDYMIILRKMWNKNISLEGKRALALRKIELESFFYSEWFEVLTDVNPSVLIKGCKQMAMEQEKARKHKTDQNVKQNKRPTEGREKVEQKTNNDLRKGMI